MSWRELEPTKKQLDFIKYIQEYAFPVRPTFEGKTRGEAADFIDKYAKYAFCNTWAVEHGYG